MPSQTLPLGSFNHGFLSGLVKQHVVDIVVDNIGFIVWKVWAGYMTRWAFRFFICNIGTIILILNRIVRMIK